MTRFYIDTPDLGDADLRQRLFNAPVDMSSVRGMNDSRADEKARWDADDRFWRIDTWTDAELCDDARFSHYMANRHKHLGGSNV